jgi:hypothetical protein
MVVLILLLVAGSVDRWVRDLGWFEEHPPIRGIGVAGAALGLVALGVAVLVATPVLEATSARSIEWTQIAAVRGNPAILVTAVMLAGAQAYASELVYRRWILDRLDDFGAPAVAALAFVAVAEGALAGGNLASRAGVAVAGVGYGLLYLGAGRRLTSAVACRVTFESGALILVGMRLL